MLVAAISKNRLKLPPEHRPKAFKNGSKAGVASAAATCEPMLDDSQGLQTHAGQRVLADTSHFMMLQRLVNAVEELRSFVNIRFLRRCHLPSLDL